MILMLSATPIYQLLLSTLSSIRVGFGSQGNIRFFISDVLSESLCLGPRLSQKPHPVIFHEFCLLEKKQKVTRLS